MDVKIRKIKEKELNDLIKLCKKHAKYENSKLTLKKNKIKKAIFDEKILNCQVAILNDKLIGYSTYLKQFSTWNAKFYLYMDCLYISKDFRNQGLGTAFIEKIKKEAKKLNCNLIQWQTPISNKKAISFYKKIGAFSKTKKRFFLKS